MTISPGRGLTEDHSEKLCIELHLLSAQCSDTMSNQARGRREKTLCEFNDPFEGHNAPLYRYIVAIQVTVIVAII